MQAINLRRQWTSRQALILVTICLTVGIAGGWLIRGVQGFANSPAPNHARGTTQSQAQTTSPQQPTTTQLKEMADAQAAPLLAKLNVKPNDADTLVAVANLYYDAQQYLIAVNYYNRTLKLRPSDASVRTDMATAYWYIGNADQAIAEFNKALAYAPSNPNTLFNLGLVKWQAKHDAAGAIADWRKLLAANPRYEQKEKVIQMLSEVEKQSGEKNSQGN